MGDESEALDSQSDGGVSDPRSPYYVPLRPLNTRGCKPEVARAVKVIGEILAGKHLDKTEGQISAMVKGPAHVLAPSPAIRGLADKALARALSRKGQFAGFLWVRPMATRKDVSSVITKEVRCVARVGLDYESMASTTEGRNDGTLPAENAGLPWGTWARFPYLIEHNGNLYLRLYPRQGGKCHVRYRINGLIADRAMIEPLCLAKEFRDDDSPRTCITLNVNNLRRMK